VGWSALEGHIAVVLLNIADDTAVLTGDLTTLGFAAGDAVVVRDVWRNATVGTFTGSFNATVLAHEAKLFRAWRA
jgi:hypothetical protein